MSELHKAAQYYASLGWRVFPLRSGTKIPATDHGVKDESTDEMQIKAWWSKWPNANIGFACGGESKVHVIDVDVDTEKGIDGWKTINELIRQEKVFPKTVCQNTPRGGAHFFYQADERPLNRNSYMHGIDIRSEGYYVLLPPSIHPNGGTYTWAQGFSPWEYGLAEYPDFMRPTAKASSATAIFPNSRLNVSPASSLPPTKSDVIERAKRYLATCEPAIQGLGGHDKIFWAAGALVHGFQLSDDEALKLLLQEYNPRCIPSWNMADPADAKDFTRKIKESRNNPPRGKQPGWLLLDPAYAPDDVPDRYHAVIGKYIAQVKARLRKPAADNETVKVEESKNTEKELRFLC